MTTDRRSRRAFMNLTGAGFAGVAAAPWFGARAAAAAADRQDPDLVVINAKVYTVDAARSWASAITTPLESVAPVILPSSWGLAPFSRIEVSTL